VIDECRQGIASVDGNGDSREPAGDVACHCGASHSAYEHPVELVGLWKSKTLSLADCLRALRWEAVEDMEHACLVVTKIEHLISSIVHGMLIIRGKDRCRQPWSLSVRRGIAIMYRQRRANRAEERSMREAEIKALLVDPFNNAPVILLKDRNSNRAMPIWIGESEAMSIAFSLQSRPFPRPLSHDLMKTIIDDLAGNVQKVVISGLEEGTYFASIFLEDSSGNMVEIDARPSDSLALALRVGSPIYIDDEVFEASAIESPFAEEDEFQDFVESKMHLAQFKRLIG